jgi:hypothetical protein
MNTQDRGEGEEILHHLDSWPYLHAILERDPLLRRTTDGVSVHVTDSESRTAAGTLLRWRIDLERFAPQLRDASP